MNKTNALNVKDYSLALEQLPSDKIKKLIDVASDSVVDLKKELQETEDYLEELKIILNKRGE